jgi:translation initiation factor 1
MQKKKTPPNNGIVYSTDPGYKIEEEKSSEAATLPAAQQKLKIRLDTKQRAGKAVTLVENFQGTLSDIEDLGKKLKTYCGTGGSVKDGQVIIQGDQRDKVMQWLLNNGFKNSRKV